jgi:hypothetical protein
MSGAFGRRFYLGPTVPVTIVQLLATCPLHDGFAAACDRTQAFR